MAPPLTAIEAAARITAGTLTAAELTEACLEQVADREPVVRAFISLDTASVRRAAAQADISPIHGPLHGIPFAVKDVIDTFDLPTQMGSPIWEGHQPRADAACVALARAAGGILFGKTVTAELAYVAPGATTNPHNPGHTPGGSSSGSAAAVAAGMVPLAIGTQTGGSVIRPASFCGVVGLKPSFGTINRAGLKFMSESLDTIGVLARSVEDAALSPLSYPVKLRHPCPSRRSRHASPSVALIYGTSQRRRRAPPCWMPQPHCASMVWRCRKSLFLWICRR